MTDAEELWGEHILTSDKELGWDIGETRLNCRCEEKEIWLSRSKLISPEQEDELSSSPEWSRWALKEAPQAVLLKPVFPDKPLVVKPENSFRLLPGVEARVFVRVPIWVSIAIPGKTAPSLCEIPTVALSLTWFGTSMEGELCYWLSSSARRAILPELYRTHLAICPIQIRNASDEDLLVDKLCLRVKWLSLFLAENQLWADETKISFRGEGVVSQVNVSATPPTDALKAQIVTKPREVLKKGFAIRTFLGL